MKTPFVLMARSAMGDHQRYAILTNELIRRLSQINVEHVDIIEVIKVIEVFTQEMKSSEYTREQIRETVIGGVKGWRRKIERRKREGIGFYRTAPSTLKTRVRKKLMERETWFKDRDIQEGEENEGERREREK